MVLNDKNEIIASSNDLGIVVLKDEIKSTNKIIFRSIFFDKKEINLKKLQKNNTVFLKPKVNVLGEVVVTGNQKKYLVITAYYRIYNIIDGILDSFVDAEVKYLKKKESFQKKALNFRIFDTFPKEKYKDATPFWITNLNSKTLFDRANKKYYLVKKEENIVNIIGKKDNKVYGTIKTGLNLTHNSNILINVIKDYKNFSITDIEEYKNDKFLTTNIKDLKYQSRTSRVIITPKMIKISPILKGKKIKINKRELFIQSVDYITKSEYKRIMKMGYKDTSISHYTKKFWKNLETFTPLDPLIEKQLNTILVERK